MTTPTKNQLKEFWSAASKTIVIIAIPLIGWFVGRWMNRMEDKTDKLLKELSEIQGDYKEINSRVNRNASDIQKLENKSHSHGGAN